MIKREPTVPEEKKDRKKWFHDRLAKLKENKLKVEVYHSINVATFRDLHRIKNHGKICTRIAYQEIVQTAIDYKITESKKN